MFAIVEIAGKQYKVTPGEILYVDRLIQAVGDTVRYDTVMLMQDEKKTLVVTPTVKGSVVTAKIVSHEKGKKLDVSRFKSKVRHRRKVGFRPYLTKLEILSVGKA